MALIDFFQLAVLFKLSCCDVGISSNRSHPPPMPATTPPSSRSPPDQSGRIAPFISPSMQFAPKTPERKRDVARSVPDLTPLSFGTSILQKLAPDADQAPKYDSAKYEEYIAQDFERHRVFVDIEMFMKHVLHVPENWRELWGPTIESIKVDDAFSIAHSDYSRQCEPSGPPEERFYKPLVDMTNAILGYSWSSLDECVKPRTRQCFLRNDPNKIHSGVMNDLSPDIVAVHDDFLPHLYPEEREERRVRKSKISWAHTLQVLEVKPSGGALIDGSSMPRLKANGKPTKISGDVVL
jgi:hypothetical protein